jgi:hypothetical protein
MRHQLAADLFQYARRCGVEVWDRKGAAFSLDLQGIANGAIVPCLTPHTERRRRAAFDQRPEKLLLFEGVLRAMHCDLVIVWETQGDHLRGHERTAARERCAQAMHCVAETFQQLSRVFRTAG